MPHNSARMAKFYAPAFGWQTQALGEAMGGYVLATTTAIAAGVPARPGAINGGFFPRKPDWPAQHPSVVVAVENVVESMALVQRAGGTVLGEPMEIPGIGKYVSFMDTEGNRASMLEPLPRSGTA